METKGQDRGHDQVDKTQGQLAERFGGVLLEEAVVQVGKRLAVVSGDGKHVAGWGTRGQKHHFRVQRMAHTHHGSIATPWHVPTHLSTPSEQASCKQIMSGPRARMRSTWSLRRSEPSRDAVLGVTL